MGLLNLLSTSPLGLAGITPALIPSAKPTSTLHYKYSIIGTPTQGIPVPVPSLLDLNGQIPAISSAPNSTQQLPYLLHLPG